MTWDWSGVDWRGAMGTTIIMPAIHAAPWCGRCFDLSQTKGAFSLQKYRIQAVSASHLQGCSKQDNVDVCHEEVMMMWDQESILLFKHVFAIIMKANPHCKLLATDFHPKSNQRMLVLTCCLRAMY